MKITTQQLLASLFMLVFLAACSRPVAYFQPTTREQFATTPAPVKSVNSVESSAPVPAVVPASDVTTTPTEQLAQANVALDQVDAMVRNDSKLSADKTVQKRLNRIRTALAATPSKVTVTPGAINAPKKMNLMERLMMKKLNKKISRQLAPNNPNKAMANTGVLAAGAVLVILGLVLLLVGSSSAVSVILILAGAVVLLVGLL